MVHQNHPNNQNKPLISTAKVTAIDSYIALSFTTTNNSSTNVVETTSGTSKSVQSLAIFISKHLDVYALQILHEAASGLQTMQGLAVVDGFLWWYLRMGVPSQPVLHLHHLGWHWKPVVGSQVVRSRWMVWVLLAVVESVSSCGFGGIRKGKSTFSTATSFR